MRELMTLLVAGAIGLAALSSAQAQTPARVKNDQSHASSQRGSSGHVKGPNAAFKNQQRKLTDPLNANGK